MAHVRVDILKRSAGGNVWRHVDTVEGLIDPTPDWLGSSYGGEGDYLVVRDDEELIVRVRERTIAPPIHYCDERDFTSLYYAFPS